MDTLFNIISLLLFTHFIAAIHNYTRGRKRRFSMHHHHNNHLTAWNVFISGNEFDYRSFISGEIAEGASVQARRSKPCL